MAHIEDDIKEILVTEEQIQNRVMELAAALSEEYRDKNPLIVGVLKGAVPFMADLVKRMDIYLELDFMVVSSYGAATRSSGVVKIIKDLDGIIEGRHLIIIEDIIDTGLTLSYLADILRRRNPKSLKVVTLLDKPARRSVDLKPDYAGFTVPDEFVVGYGLDYAERYRNLPYVGVLKPKVYADA